MHLNIVKKIQEGAFGKVFEAKLSNEHDESVKEVAVKIDRTTDTAEHPMLLHEACALSILKGNQHIPKLYGWGRSQYFEYLALQKLGPSLDGMLDSIEYWTYGMSLRSMVSIVCQMIDILKHVHSKGIVHRDIKPDNILFGPPNTKLAGQLFLIDFGLCTFYRDPKSGTHLPNVDQVRRTGCWTYASMHDHWHQKLSRRDDMISLAFIITSLLISCTPWSPLDGEDRRLEVKQHWSKPGNACRLGGGYPEVFGRFFDYVHTLEYDETPEYDGWKAQFRQLVPGLQGDQELLFDPKDNSDPRVGECLADINLAEEDEKMEEAEFLLSNSRPVIRWCNNGWVPAKGMAWRGPHSLDSEELLDDDELKFAMALRINIFKDTPTSAIPFLDATCPPEVMHQID